MKLTELFLGELDAEAPAPRRVIERVPEGRNDWKPHEKSMPLGYLASLVASMPGWINFMVTQDELDLASPKSDGFRPKDWHSRSELLELLDKSQASARETLANTTDEHLMTK